MKLLLVADWHGEIYAQAFYDAFKNIGINVYKFSWKEYFRHYQYAHAYPTDRNIFKSIYFRFQNKFIIGPVIKKINKDLIYLANQIKPDLVFIYRGTHIYPETIKIIKRNTSSLVFGYNNDDPFSKHYPKYFWRHFLKSIPNYDHIFAFRPKNIQDYKDFGYNKVSLLRPYYIKNIHFPISNINTNKYKCDVIFIGHFENDGRDESIKFLLEKGIDMKLYGTCWNKSKLYNFFKKRFGIIKPIYGKDYNLALNSAKIALVFLSKKNNDTCTRRCFEIPATKTMMMAEYNEDLASLFKEGIEAEYFRDKYELFKKIEYYLSNPEKIELVGDSGYKRLLSDGHEVTDRCKQVINVYEDYR